MLPTQVADRWQVRPCVAACCAAICGQKASALTWDDCSSLLNLPEGLREHRDMAPCIVLGMAALVSLANPAPPASFPPPPFMASASSPVPTEAELAAMSSQLHRLPASVRLALLKGCKLGFVGMLALLGSDDQVADSEDALATLLCNYLKSGSVRELSASQIKTLKDQLRCQHMSNAFLGFDLPSMSLLCLDLQQLSLLMYLRGLSNFDSIPVQHRQSTVPTAWYEPPRKSAAGQRNKVHLTLQISESALSEHLKHLASMKSGGKAPAPIFGPAAELNGISWRMMLASPTIHQQLWLAVQPVFGGAAPRRTGMFAELVCSKDGVDPVFLGKAAGSWLGAGGTCVAKFVPACSYRAGDATELAWWKDDIVDGHVRFVATVTL